MRFEHGGMLLWFGTADAPAPTGSVPLSSANQAAVTVAVQPPSASNSVQVIYRVNGGTAATVNAKILRQDLVRKVQYFSARLPAFRAGDKVEYVAVARSPGKQVPSPSDSAKFPSSFNVAPTVQGSTANASIPGAHSGSNSPPNPLSNPRPGVHASRAGDGAVSGAMNKVQLLALARNADFTVREIEKAEPTLGRLLVQTIGSQRKRTVLSDMKGGSAALMDALQKINFSPTAQTTDTIGRAINAGLAAQKASQSVVREAEKKVSVLERSGRLADEADPATPIKRHPLFEQHLKQAALYKLTDSVRLADAKAERLVGLAGSPTLVDDDMLASLVADKTLTTAEANSLGLVLSLCFIAGGSADLAVEIKPRIQTLPDITKVSSAEWQQAITRSKADPPDGLDAAGYALALRRAATNLYPTEALDALSVPADMQLLEQALTILAPLADKNDKVFGPEFEELDSSAVSAERLSAAKDAHRNLLTFAHRHPGLGLVDVLNGRDTPAEKISVISKRLEVLKKLRALNPDTEFMGLDYTEGSGDRLALKTDGLSAHDVLMAVAHLKASQRVHAMTKDVDHTCAIMGAGYASSCAIAIDDPEDFRRKTGLNGETARHYHKKATSSLSRASHAVVSSIDAYDGPFHRMPVGNVRSSIKDHLKAIPGFSELFGSQDYCNCTECQSILGAPAYFVDLMTFVEEHLTGRVFRGKKAHDPLNLRVRRPDLWTLPLTCDNTYTLVPYLDIINPILENYIATQHGGHKADLSDRNRIESVVYEHTLSRSHKSFYQPFTLPLENLDTYLEHFSITRLHVARALGADPAVIVKAALKISDAVYRQLKDANPDHGFLKDVYGIEFAFAGTAAHVNAMNIKELFQATGYSRSDLEKVATSRFVTRDGTHKVHIHSEKKNPESVQNDVEKISGLTGDALHRLYRFTRLLRSLPWSISELDLILTQLDAAGSVIGADERVLDHLVQILHLRRRWDIPVDQLCALWSPIPSTPKSGGLFERLFNFLAQTDGPLPRPDIKFVHAAFSKSGKAFTFSVSHDSVHSPLAHGNETEHSVGAHHHSDVSPHAHRKESGLPEPVAHHAATSRPTHQNTTERLLAALQVSDTELAGLIANLHKALGANINSSIESEHGFILSLHYLTLLYRHALLARLLNVRISDLFQLIQLADLPNQIVSNIDDLATLLEFFDWYQESGYSLDDLGTITKGPVQAPASYPNSTDLAGKLAANVATDHSLEFSDRVFMLLLGVTEAESQQMIAGNSSLFQTVPGAIVPTFTLTPALRPGTALQFSDTVFAFLPGVTEAQSQQIVAANPTLFVSSPNVTPPALQLSAVFGPETTITIPDGISLDAEDTRAALLRYSDGAGGAGAVVLNYHPVNIIPSALSKLLGVDVGIMTQLFTMTGVDLSSPDIFQALQAGAASQVAPLGPLASVIGKVIPLKVLFAGGGYTADDATFVQQNASIFGIADFNKLKIANVRGLSVYGTFATNLVAAGQTDMTPLRAVLSSFSSTAQFNRASPAELALVLGIDQRQLRSILPNVTLPATAPEALLSLSTIATLAKTLGLGGDALKLVLSDSYSDQALASDALLGAFRAQFHDQQKFADRFQPFDDRIRSRKRDALTDYLLTCKGHQFGTLEDLYNYFLLDVQLEGCMRTSWVVAAISSVQLYVYRCIMNLEQDQRDSSDPPHIEVKLATEAAEEWEWRQNYRVWQANREVLLFPENYILPELRDDKTPLFENLESTLLQQPITEQNVLDAYSTYMSGFDQLSKLQIAGSYHDIDKESATDVLHLFGVTPSDPPTFFYRTIENATHGETETDRAATYTPWVPVNLQIHCREVSPIVYLGRLFVFWTQISTAPTNLVTNASSVFDGYKHTWRVKYSSLRLDATWTPPQQLAIADTMVFPVGDGIVMDPLLDPVDKYNYGREINTADLILALSNSSPSQSQQTLITSYEQGSGIITNEGILGEVQVSDFSLAIFQASLAPLYDTRVHTAPIDGYTLTGFQWNRVYPTADPDFGDMLMAGRNFFLQPHNVDFYNQVIVPTTRVPRGKGSQSVLCSKQDSRGQTTYLYTGLQDAFPYLERYPWCSIAAKDEHIQKLSLTYESSILFGSDLEFLLGLGNWQNWPNSPLEKGLYRKLIGLIPGNPDIAIINSSATDAITDAIIDSAGDVLLLQASLRPGEYVMKRLSTTLGENLSRALFVRGINGLLSIDTQVNLGESAPQLVTRENIQSDVVVGRMDFAGAMGTYFREIFFHVPFLIASQLNSQQNFPAALEWYRYIFDPTANDDGLLTPEERAERDRVRDEIVADIEHHVEGQLEDIVRGADPRRLRVREHEEPEHDGSPEEIRHLNTELVGLGARDREKAEHDRVWRFIEFRGLDVPSLRKILTNSAALDAYEQNPFNPHAIARLRLSAYQKCMAMNYVDVLIEWGDSLFAEFQMETVNEATLLYVQALEILGPRPETVGNCGEGNEKERTYENIAPLVKKGSDFLVEMETYSHTGTGAARAHHKVKPTYLYIIGQAVAEFHFKEAVTACKRRAVRADHSRETAESERSLKDDHRGNMEGHSETGRGANYRHAPKVNAERGSAHPLHWKGKHGAMPSASGNNVHKGLGRKSSARTSGGHAPRFAWSVVRHVLPAFCVPPNADLLRYWDLIEDRLYKIRHGMDITGASRQLALFAPPIDPMLLVEATAAGLSLDDVLNATSGDVPPYRFTYLIEKARQYASQVQSFGGALLSAIEKRDAQQLEVLRVTQQQNILAMTTSMKRSDVDAAQNAVDTLNAQLDTAQFRHNYFQGLLDGGLNVWELTEFAFRILAVQYRPNAAALYTQSAITHLVPDIGSPFSMKFGGMGLGAALTALAKGIGYLAAYSDSIAAAAGLLGGHERRSDGWQHEVDMATKDITQLNTQLVGANIRLKIANKALDIHNRTIAQEQQVADFYTSRFSNVALYTWLATTMQTTCRQAYSSAYAMAKLAEQAYRFERNDETTSLLSGPYWSQNRSGLLAGEMLLGDLQTMERRFIETNYRTPEITQSFSMMQIAPDALLNLRQNASCSFDIPELCFDLFYPGQYCRKIKAVRLTIPCVTGPLTNVGATLTLTSSKLRLKPKSGDTNLIPIQLKHSVVIATSTAQNDTGIFEFSFRDERYMPFEGAGAISTWKVELPDGFRQFDYQTITDVIVHISYTAQQDDGLRQSVEQRNGTIATVLKNQPLGRLFSLRQEFPTALNRLQHSATNTPVSISISANYLPFFVASSAIQVTTAKLLLRTAASQTVENFSITIDGTSVTGFAVDPDMGNLWSSDVSTVFAAGMFGDHPMTVRSAGNLAPDTPQPGISAAIDDTKLLDVVLYVEYQLAAA
jgi:Tc toxin complex TcA C-terminal TcB-binding domain/Neuraminidase-like domain